MENLEKLSDEANSLQLNDNDDRVAGYSVHKTEHVFRLLPRPINQRRGKYQVHRTAISWWTEEFIAAFEYSLIPIIPCFGSKLSSNTIVKIPVRKVGMKILGKYFNSSFIV